MKNFAKRISALVLAVVVSAAVLCPAAFAAQLPSLPKDQCVVDGAGVLSSSTVQTITELNAQLESSCSGAQIDVLTVEYTGNDSTEDYATQAFNAWGIGSSSNNNGVLILLVMESAQYADGDYYLTYGDGFRNTTLAKQSSAIAQTMEDQFAAKDYDGAVTTCARNVANTIADIYGVSLSGSAGNGSTVQPGYQGGQSSGGSALTDILTLVVSVVLLIVIIRSMAYVFASPCGWLWCFWRAPASPWTAAARPHNPPPPRRAASTAALAAWAAAPSGRCRPRRFRRRQLWRRLRWHGRWFQPRRRRWPWAVMRIKRERQWLYHCLSLFYAFYRERNSFDKTILVTYTG